ncbi:DUF2637 domain-containing protein [Pseudonocardia petroleophila]|uniref:DUF2637 domain-containing protein n=1 Tax=Pseudonocardia petroleophila TaxID=37331 RepID=UPI00210525BD|nr:DUF2637 domain-containing protein [Pseudonocardia petroleophila]
MATRKKGASPGVVTWAGLAVVAGAAAILTFTTLRDLAIACGISDTFLGVPLAWLLPITVDAAGAVAIRVWLTQRASPAASRLARRLSWFCIILSILGNAGQHGMAAYGIVPPWWVIVLVSAVPPAMFGAVTHLAVLLNREDEGAWIWGPDPQPNEDIPSPPVKEGEDESAPEEPAVEPDDEPEAESRAPGDGAKLDQLRAWMADHGGEVPSKRKVIELCGVGHPKAGKLIEALEPPKTNGVKVL